MLTTSEITRIARAVIAVRPEWKMNEVYTYLDQRMRDRGFQELLIAAVWVASDPNTRKLVRLEASGPWWLPVGQGQLGVKTRINDIPDDQRCTTCHRHEQDCDGKATSTHTFKSVATSNAEWEQVSNDPEALERRKALIAQARAAAQKATKQHKQRQRAEI